MTDEQKQPETQDQGSEVARLRKQLEAEYEAAMLGLQGLAQGVSKHEFITKRMERVGELHEQLKGIVGEEEAIKIVTEINDKAAEQKPEEPKGDK